MPRHETAAIHERLDHLAAAIDALADRLDTGHTEPTDDGPPLTAAGLVRDNSRAELDGIALALELDPTEYGTKTAVAEAIVEACA